MKLFISLVLMIFFLNSCYSQQAIEKISSANYVVAGKRVLTAKVTFPSSAVNRIFWIEDEAKTGWMAQRLIKSHFYKRQGDFTLQEMLGIDKQRGPALIGQTFFRICPSNETLTLQFYSTDSSITTVMWTSYVKKWVDSHVVLIEEETVKELVPNLRMITTLGVEDLIIELPMFSPAQ